MSLNRSISNTPLEKWQSISEIESTGSSWKDIVTTYVTSTPLLEDNEEAYKTFFSQFWKDYTSPATTNPDKIIQAAKKGYDVFIVNWLSSPISEDERQLALHHRSSQGYTALHVASQKGHVNIVNALLDKGADLHAKTPLGDTALHLASDEGHEKVAAMLLKNGADVNAIGNLLATPLHRAAYYKHANIAALLLKNGASCEMTRNDGDKPIHIAAQMGADEVVKTLITHDKNQLTTTGREQRTALFVAALNERLNVMEVLLANGDDVDQINPHAGQSPLHFAAIKDKPEMIALLLKHNAKVDLLDTSLFTPLQRAAMQKNPSLDAAIVLVNAGANVNQSIDGNHPAPLFCLAKFANQRDSELTKFAQLLISKDAKVDATFGGQTAFDLLKKRKDQNELLPNELGLYNYLSNYQSNKSENTYTPN